MGLQDFVAFKALKLAISGFGILSSIIVELSEPELQEPYHYPCP